MDLVKPMKFSSALILLGLLELEYPFTKSIASQTIDEVPIVAEVRSMDLNFFIFNIEFIQY